MATRDPQSFFGVRSRVVLARLDESKRLGRYELLRELGRGATGVVYEARDAATNGVVALKALVSLDAENLFRLKHEFRSLANFEHENLVRFGELACEGGQWFFTMERVYGADFLEYVNCARPAPSPEDAAPDTPSTSSSRLRAATSAAETDGVDVGAETREQRLRRALAQLVDGLAVLHESGRIHRDVKPSNVLVTPDERVVLLDFGLMTDFGLDDRAVGTPAYMAPEQVACERLTPASDWYAVGVILFVALTGRMPFVGKVHEVMQAKVTEDAPQDWAPGAPEDLRALCGALLARDPAARPGVDEIRSRLGIRAPPRAAMREIFVGREAELEWLRAARHDAARGATRALVVRGEAGMGKSTLVDRFLSDVAPHTLVLRGRCYEQESVPFGGADSLVDALSEYLLGLEASEVEALLGLGAANMARVFPVLRRVEAIARQRADGPVLSPTTLREQAFRELACLVANLAEGRTLVVYVDDLQWLDGDSLALIRAVFLARGPTRGRRMFVATLRSGSPLTPKLEEFAASLECVELPRFSMGESLALWRALCSGGDGPTRETALQEAGGHPFLLTEIVRAARAPEVGAGTVTHLDEALWRRVAQRDVVERTFLEMTALAGAPVPYAVVAQAAGLDVAECLTRLSALRAAQLVRVTRVDDDRCVEPYHERIREAVLARLRKRGPGAMAAMHLALGRALLAAAGDGTPVPPSQIFAIVHHLGLGRTGIESEVEMTRLAELHLQASREAHRATAFERARRYAAAGIACLPAGGRPTGLATWRDLHVALFSAEYMTVGRSAARATFDAARTRVDSPLDAAAVCVPWIDLEANNYARDAVEVGCEVLERLGAPAPYPTERFDVVVESLRAMRAQRGRPANALRRCGRLRDETLAAVLRTLEAMMPAAYFCEENLFPWAMLRMASISMSKGLSDESPLGLAGYGMVLAGALHRYADGAELGRVARDMARTERNARILAKVEFIYPAFLSPWVSPFAEGRRGLLDAEVSAARCGDTPYQTNAVALRSELAISMGADLETVQAEAKRALEVSLQFSVQGVAEHSQTVDRYASALRGEGAAGLGFPAAWLASDLALLRYHYLSAELDYLGGRDARGIERQLAEVDRRAHTVFASPLAVDIRFLRALVAARACASSRLPGRIRRILGIARAARRLDHWARSCPANFEAYSLIVGAELARLLGRRRTARARFEQAIASARRYGAPKREAIACELASDFERERGDAGEATRFRVLAIDAYRRWGATAKANALAATR